VIYRDTFGSTTAETYDYYQEVERGETFTLHLVANTTPPSGTGPDIVDYVSAFWFDETVIENTATVLPTPNYTSSWLTDMGNPAIPQYQVSNYVQVTNWNSLDVGQMVWESPDPADPFVLLSWDIPIRADAPLGLTTLALRFRTHDIAGQEMLENRVEVASAFTINVVPHVPRLGDFDDDDDIDAIDIDILAEAIRDNLTDPEYDVDGDGDVDSDDLTFEIRSLADTPQSYYDSNSDEWLLTGTELGDFNLDGAVGILDLGAVGDNYNAPGGWSEGDANGDGVITILDLGLLGDFYGYPTVTGIPEPTTAIWLLAGVGAMLKRRTGNAD